MFTPEAQQREELIIHRTIIAERGGKHGVLAYIALVETALEYDEVSRRLAGKAEWIATGLKNGYLRPDHFKLVRKSKPSSRRRTRTPTQAYAHPPHAVRAAG